MKLFHLIAGQRKEEGASHIPHYYSHPLVNNHCIKNKISIKDFFSKCDQIRIFLKTWSNLLKKSLMENYIFLCNDWYITQTMTPESLSLVIAARLELGFHQITSQFSYVLLVLTNISQPGISKGMTIYSILVDDMTLCK